MKSKIRDFLYAATGITIDLLGCIPFNILYYPMRDWHDKAFHRSDECTNLWCDLCAEKNK